MTIKIGEQIAFLRKQKGMTQESLAGALHVTNQAVSKWEAAQCCPDIQLLPEIAKLFDVSVDELLGYAPASAEADLVLALRRKVDALPQGEDFSFTFRMAAALHAILLSKEMTAAPKGNPGWDTDDAITHAGQGEWGFSCFYTPEVTTTMRGGAVFFASNQALVNFQQLRNQNLRRISALLRTFSDPDTLKIAAALYELTVHDENAYETVSKVSEKAGKPEEQVRNCLAGPLAPFLLEQGIPEGGFRFDGMYMNVLPILSLLDFR